MMRLIAHPLMMIMPWLALMVAMWFDDQRRHFTVAWHDILMIVGFVIAIAGTLAWLFLRRRFNGSAPAMSWTGLLVQALPLYCVVAVNPGTLSMDADDDFMRLRHPAFSQSSDENLDAIPEDLSQITMDLPTRFDGTPLNPNQTEHLGMSDPESSDKTARALNLIEVNQPDARRIGGRVSVIGRFVMPTQQRLDQANRGLAEIPGIPLMNAALYRHTMTCCAGDAQVVNVLLATDPSKRVAANAWVEIIGRVYDTGPGIPVMIEVESMKPVDAPKVPYLSLAPFHNKTLGFCHCIEKPAGFYYVIIPWVPSSMIDDALLSQVAVATASSVLICDKDRKLIWCNPAFERLSGYQQSEVLGRTPGSFLQGPQSSQETIAAMSHAFARGETFDGELLNYAKDGSYYWVHLVVNPVRDSSGAITNYIGIQNDITQRREDRIRLDQLSQRLSLAAASGGIGIWDFDVTTGELIWDDLMHEIYGVNRAESQGTYEDWRSALLPEELPVIEQALQNAIAGNANFDNEFRIKRKTDGALRWVKGAATVIRDAQGDAQRVLGVNYDVTERHELETKLEHLGSLLERTNEAARVSAWELDLATSKPWWSQVTRDIHEVDADYVPNLEEAINFYKEGEDRASIVAAIERALVTKEPWEVELRLITAKQHERWVRLWVMYIAGPVAKLNVCTVHFRTLINANAPS